MGDGGVRDNFEAGKKTPQLRAFLDHVGAEGGELFVLGDLFELWQMNLSRLCMKRLEILDQLAALPMIYVPGNHDVDLAHFAGTSFMGHPFFAHLHAPFSRTLGGRQFRFFHGHEVDEFNAGDDPGFGRMLAIFAGIFEDMNGSPLLETGETAEDVLEQFGDSMLTLWTLAMATVGRNRLGKEVVAPKAALTPAQNPDRLADYLRGVRADREARAYDVAVLGHTHKPGRIGDWYFNSGSWTGAQSSFLRISPDGDVRYFEWHDRRPVEHEVRVLAEEKKPAPRPDERDERDVARPIAKRVFDAPRAAIRRLFPKPTKPERSRWITIAQGALALGLGVAALNVTVTAGSSAGLRLLVTAFGLYALVDGGLSLALALREAPFRRLLNQVRGVASLLLGLVILLRGYSVEVFVILVGVWAFVSGALRVAASVVFQKVVDSRWLAIVGGGSMIAGVILLLWPASASLLKIAIAGYLCYYGATELLAGVFGQRRLMGARRGSPSPSGARGKRHAVRALGGPPTASPS
ncbi:MAG: DUF308 domain-containing protein [Labilithrix sp.]|nr:DUF308 domain-containing protein [Labilithrix sp.]